METNECCLKAEEKREKMDEAVLEMKRMVNARWLTPSTFCKS